MNSVGEGGGGKLSVRLCVDNVYFVTDEFYFVKQLRDISITNNW